MLVLSSCTYAAAGVALHVVRMLRHRAGFADRLTLPIDALARTGLQSNRNRGRVVFAGRGAEIVAGREPLRGRRFRLVDELPAAGTLTEAGGEPAVILPVEEGSFDRAGCIFFAGSRRVHDAQILPAARSGAGAKTIDLSGAMAESDGTVAWFPKLDWLRGRDFRYGSEEYLRCLRRLRRRHRRWRWRCLA